MSGLNPVDVVEEDAADLLFPKDLSMESFQRDSFSENICKKCNIVVREPFVSCADCNEIFCLACFAKGSETVKHRNDHDYKIQQDDFNLFDSDWTAREEKSFLNAILTCGVENWEEISYELKGKSPEECKKHFYKFYFSEVNGNELKMSQTNACTRHNVPYLLRTNSLDPPRGDEKNFISQSMSGYRFARSDFDIPYDSSAESILKNVMLSDETVFEKDKEMREVVSELNCAMFRAYNHRLKERKRRYCVVQRHGLILQRKTLAWLAKYSEVFHQQSHIGKFVAFMQISEPTTFDFLMESLKLFSDTKRHLYRLYELRKNGITSVADGKLYDKLKAKRQNSREKNENMLNWRKLLPENPSKVSVISPSVPQRKKATPLDIIGLPGYDSLTDEEKSICSELRLTPNAFNEYKRILVKENESFGYLRLSDARRLIKIDVNKTRAIYNFLIKYGYVNSPLNV